MTVQQACEVLGVPLGASFEEIKAAYRERAKRYHPDLHGEGVDNLERFQRVQAAYEILPWRNGDGRDDRASGRTGDAAEEDGLDRLESSGASWRRTTLRSCSTAICEGARPRAWARRRRCRDLPLE